MPVGTSAWTPLANVTLASAAATVTFSSISGAHRDLVLIVRSASASTGALQVRFNSNSSNIYTFVHMFKQGATGFFSDGGSRTGIIYPRNNNPSALGGGSARLEIFDYATTNKHKQVLLRSDDIDPVNAGEFHCVRWGSTTAITSIQISGQGINLLAGSTFALYGVSA
jgi:hypothetical protein